MESKQAWERRRIPRSRPPVPAAPPSAPSLARPQNPPRPTNMLTMMTPGRITVPRFAFAFFGLVATLCGLQPQVVAAAGSLATSFELPDRINALFELQKAGGLSIEQFTAATNALIASVSQETQLNDKPPPAHRQLQQPGGTPLPPPSGTCPDVAGVQQGLDATDARVDALEVYTDVSAAPRGLIAMWSGAVDTVPQGWALCDGNSGTPDLRDKFVVGAGSKYEIGSSTDVGENVGASTTWTAGGADVDIDVHGGDSHDNNGRGIHTGRDLDVNFGEPVPAHYALAFIMRLDATCCICYCDDARPTQPVPVVVPYGTAHDVACRTKCAEPSACGHAGGHFADAFSSACV